MEEKYIIPRNVINADDTFPFDFITHIEIEKRQLPYLLTGAAISVYAITTYGNFIPLEFLLDGKLTIGKTILTGETANTLIKSIFGLITFGTTWLLSNISFENQHLETLLNNLILYNVSLLKFKYQRSEFSAKNFKGGIPKFTIKKR